MGGCGKKLQKEGGRRGEAEKASRTLIAFSRDSRDPPFCLPAMTAHQAALAGTATLQRAPCPVPTAYVTSATPDLHDSETSYAISHADVKLDRSTSI